ncbi:MAG TPA: hypothetical protein EYH05_08960, partial [Anaerolineae bacterium]|nr:hypothetical protein [Anaerolineae bacterium]
MTQSSRNHLTTLQQALLDIVHKYPSRFSRSGLAKMLVGVKSWQGREYPEYGRFSTHGRKNLTYQIDILLQQGFLAL